MAKIDCRNEQMFPKLAPKDIERLHRFGAVCHYATGEALFITGNVAPGMYVLNKGSVRVTRRDPLGHTRGVVEARRQLHDAVPEADVLRPLRGRRQEHLRRARVRVLLEEVVLDLPDVVEPEPVGQLDLVERVVQQLLERAVGPRPRHLELVEQSEAHRR